MRETLRVMKQDETDLVRQAMNGDRGAFAALVESHWRALVSFARSVVGDGAAEDAVQDALVTAWGKLGHLRDSSAFSAWVRRMVLRQCLRRKRSWRNLLPMAAAREPVFEIDPNAELDLQRCLKALAPRQRAVMYLTVVEGRSDRDIGALMEISAASVRSHRRRARRTLNHLLNDPVQIGACHES